MAYVYTAPIYDDIEDIGTFLGWMVLAATTFADTSGYFPGQTIEKVFFGLNESFKRIRGKVGDEQYIQLEDMACRVRAHFEADPEDKTADTIIGRELIEDMRDLLKAAAKRDR
jgi:hypothetical protein